MGGNGVADGVGAVASSVVTDAATVDCGVAFVVAGVSSDVTSAGAVVP